MCEKTHLIICGEQKKPRPDLLAEGRKEKLFFSRRRPLHRAGRDGGKVPGAVLLLGEGKEEGGGSQKRSLPFSSERSPYARLSAH